MSGRVTCRRSIELLLDYLEGRLPAPDHEGLDRHFAECPPCLEFVRSYRETPRIAREAAGVQVPPEVAERLRRFLAARRRR